MIESVSLTNLGPFKNTCKIDFKPETFFIGKNNSGKSFILTSILLGIVSGPSQFGQLRQDISQWLINNALVNSNYSSLVRGYDRQGQGTIDLSFTDEKNQTDSTIQIKGDGTYTLSIILNKRVLNLSQLNDRDLAAQIYESFSSRILFLSSKRPFIPTTSNVKGAGSISTDASNIPQFLLTTLSTSRDKISQVEEWMAKIDPNFKHVNPRVSEDWIYVSSNKSIDGSELNIPLSAQGSGLTRALQIISAIVLSPKGSIIIIEEPEMNLHPGGVEVLFDLFNYAVRELNHQIIVTTHSWDMILPVFSDLSLGHKRGADHILLDKDKFTMYEFEMDKNNESKAKPTNFNAKYTEVKAHFKDLLT